MDDIKVDDIKVLDSIYSQTSNLDKWIVTKCGNPCNDIKEITNIVRRAEFNKDIFIELTKGVEYNFWASPFSDGKGDYFFIQKIVSLLEKYKSKVNLIILIEVDDNMYKDINDFELIKHMDNLGESSVCGIYRLKKENISKAITSDYNKSSKGYYYQHFVTIIDYLYECISGNSNIQDIIFIIYFNPSVIITSEDLSAISSNNKCFLFNSNIINISYLHVYSFLDLKNCPNMISLHEDGVVFEADETRLERLKKIKNTTVEHFSAGFSRYSFGIFLLDSIPLKPKKYINSLGKYHFMYMSSIHLKTPILKLVLYLDILIKHYGLSYKEPIFLLLNEGMYNILELNKDIFSYIDIGITVTFHDKKIDIIHKKVKFVVYFYPRLDHDDFLYYMNESEPLIYVSGDQSFHEGISMKKKIFYDLPPHKVGAYQHYMNLLCTYFNRSLYSSIDSYIELLRIDISSHSIYRYVYDDISRYIGILYNLINDSNNDNFINFIKKYYNFELNLLKYITLWKTDKLNEYSIINKKIDNPRQHIFFNKYLKYKNKYIALQMLIKNKLKKMKY
jgi:hypothetical protein